MPTLLKIKGLRFYFWSKDHRPMHVHIEEGKGGATAKVEIEPDIRVVEVQGFSKGDMRKILKICKQAKEDFQAAWEEYFND